MSNHSRQSFFNIKSPMIPATPLTYSSKLLEPQQIKSTDFNVPIEVV